MPILAGETAVLHRFGKMLGCHAVRMVHVRDCAGMIEPSRNVVENISNDSIKTKNANYPAALWPDIPPFLRERESRYGFSDSAFTPRSRDSIAAVLAKRVEVSRPGWKFS